ncbi:Fic family protein [Jannaschia ovalis]|uniref:Fic family protein n=1 Tax=Jannaschia ovalis TaxID=3038773 RepID=A0ABY8LGZ6_9RHOB|nr:Fic family protein [Jannaschia sp. GRR-S6-38]WGH79454.1 Fic family protein [Jannaschia sp. GRR-S6-38]
MADRKSEAEVPVLISDPIELAEKEAANALDQFDWGMDEVERWIKAKRPSLNISMVLTLHRKAMDGIDPYAGNFRPAGVAIKGSSHEPISGEDVARHVEEMLEYLKANWSSHTATHLSSYVMWRLNWIHPFSDGNGRTSRILSYMVLCGKLEKVLPGTNTIPEQIAENKSPYYNALEAADEAWKRGKTDLGEMEGLLEGYLANQLLEVHNQATGGKIYTEGEDEDPKNGIVSKIESHPVIAGGLFLLLATILGLLAS